MAKTNLELSDADRAALTAAVEAAEAGHAGEIVPFAAGASDAYEAASWRGATIGGVSASLLAAALWYGSGSWGVPAVWIALPAALGALLGLWLVRVIPAWRRALAGEDLLEREVRQRAVEAFLAEEVFRTRDRTGILIFLSLFERRVVILADRGIHEVVTQEEWDGIAHELASGIGAGRAVPALLRAIERCGALLRERRPATRGDDVNELADGVRVTES